jgi:hypothetical protein
MTIESDNIEARDGDGRDVNIRNFESNGVVQIEDDLGSQKVKSQSLKQQMLLMWP